MRSCIAALAVLVCAAFAPAPRVEYVLSPVLQGGALTAVTVQFSFRGDADGETSIRIPSSWASESELWRGIEGLSASGAQIVETGDAGERVLRHRPNARVRVSYRVIQDWDGEPTGNGGNPYRPIVRPGYYHLIGQTALVQPDIDRATRVRVRALGFPRNWSFASDLEHRGLTLDALDQSIIVGGDYRVITRGPMRVAMRGAWAFTDEALTDRIEAILAAQRAFWGDRDEPFLVTVTQLTPRDASSRSIGGTGLSDAFAFFATPNAEEATIARVLAHEGQHTWVPRRIGGLNEEDEASQYWLSEGFTDFYTGRVMVRAGLWTPEEFAVDLNRMLRAYSGSPARTETNARINGDFWNDPDVRALPYQRGRLLATIWDQRLRANGAGRDFDDVVLEMKRRSMADAMADRPQIYATDLFVQVAPEMGLALGGDLQTYVEQGAAILLPENAFTPCGRVTTRQAPRFHRGFDVEATTANNNVVTGLNPRSPAYAAGLRDGMTILRRDSGEVGNAEVEIVYAVRDGDTERTIRFMPTTDETYTLQEFVLESPLEGERLAQCRAVLGGG
jgi:predicted metalloprotease with PDZ domain